MKIVENVKKTINNVTTKTKEFFTDMHYCNARRKANRYTKKGK